MFGGFGGLLCTFLRRGFVGFDILFEEAEFALEGAFDAVFVALHEFVAFDVEGAPLVRWDVANGELEIVVLELNSEAEPLRLRGFEDEFVFEGVGIIGVISGLPAGEKF